MNNKLPPIIFLMGTTASRKTYLAMKLSKIFPIELISVDSSLIYKWMNIGTAKPNKKDLYYTKHWLIDIKEPYEYYSVFEFYYDVLKIIKLIIKKGKIPLLVGGSMFYYKKLIEPISSLPSTNVHIRNFIIKKINNHSKYKTLHDLLNKVDSCSANKIHPSDLQRNLRALEVFFLTGKPLSQLIKIKKNKIPYKIYQFALTYYNRNKLHDAINERLIKMFQLGFETEVRHLLHNKKLQINFPSMRCIGYKPMYFYIKNEINYTDMFNQIILSTRHLAKKQLTWLKNWNNIYWLNSENLDSAYNSMIKVINKIFL
ncbi:tRNA (adenosine(37)-N6)-dimethylallyltransferase MiaA [Enterobacteriaceae endosymbiont of Plateumaris consimilis]|uniref:tRNA (adenosine(37)-N6)-dimethylallyltransferase MiaA n=1 Tax=Enterobacteriaceae endosymbiont of Plateumaris consimilis TaxID=2675794 RepID=UPI0014498349|nr:tRNA (adenosine(37)-N6)-dimethylallyltransferase MiaA [Enterobacteriaceae endosymbiont of Plateumaris consimilis]QJC28589.1 tRNA (adenosine(37)-N6)-dimethylallyltransferase MiaA [Enterobacteriaceae endosymbiont of Plateumaris consimilis]